MAVLLGAALLMVAVSVPLGLIPVACGLFLLGFANGAWDVAMNVQGAVIEQRLGRSILPRFHAGFSFGTVIGALIGAGMVVLSVPVTAHLAVVGIAVSTTVVVAVQRFVTDDSNDPPGSDTGGRTSTGVLEAWREPRTLLIGVFALAFGFAEGTGNDWISVAMIDGYGAHEALAGLAFAAFLAAMTVGRWLGPVLLDRYGRVVVLRTLALVGSVGVLLFVFGTNVELAFTGTLLWGAGVSLGFPVAISAAADEPSSAPARVSVIASIGYCAFLGGPPLVGLLGDHSTVLRALTSVAVLLGVAIILAGATRPLTADD